ncbi:Bard1, partial [Symbiodinium pilosum]
QRILRDAVVLEDQEKLASTMDLQLVLLPFCETSREEVAACTAAAQYGWVSELERILSLPQDPDLCDDAMRMAPLHAACAHGQLEAARLLLEAGAAKDVGAYYGTPLHLAAGNGNVQIMRFLL